MKNIGALVQKSRSGSIFRGKVEVAQRPPKSSQKNAKNEIEKKLTTKLKRRHRKESSRERSVAPTPKRTPTAIQQRSCQTLRLV